MAARTLEEARRKVAGLWDHLADVSKRLAASMESVGSKVSEKIKDVRSGTVSITRGVEEKIAAATGMPHISPRYRQAAEAIQQLRAQPPLEKIREGTRAEELPEELRLRPLEPLGTEKQGDARKHYEAIKKDTEQVTRHTTSERKSREEEEAGSEKGGKTGMIAAAAFELGRVITNKATEERSERAKFEGHLDKFAEVNGRIAASMSNLETSRFRDRVATGKAIEQQASDRLEAQRQYEEDTAGGRQAAARISEGIGQMTDEIRHTFGRLWYGLLESISPGKKLTPTIGDPADPPRPVAAGGFNAGLEGALGGAGQAAAQFQK